MKSHLRDQAISIGSENAEVVGHFPQESQVGLVDPATYVLVGKAALVDLVVELEGEEDTEVISDAHLSLDCQQVIFMSQPLIIVQQDHNLAQSAMFHCASLQI